MNGPIQRVGYIGLGAMGAPIAANLLKTVRELVVWNRTPAKCAPLVARGATQASSLRDLGARGCEAIFLNVNDGPAVRAVLLDESTGLAAVLQPGAVVIDNSTISPLEAREIAAELAVSGIEFLDAPVSGGRAGAEQGTLSIMVGGEVATFQRCLPLLQAIGKTISHLGPAGMGQAAKACNQVAVACNLLGVCEALALARKLGVDGDKLIDLLNGGGAASQQLKNYGAKILRGDLQPGFAVKLMLKDLGIARGAAEALHLPLQAVALAEGYLRDVAAAGGDELGTQAMSRKLEELGGFRFAEDRAQ